MVNRKSRTPKRRKSTNKPRKTSALNFQVGTKVFKLSKTIIREIRKLQSSTTLCIPKLPFSRVIREVLMECTSVNMKLERKALEALQEAAEVYITQLFEDSNRCAMHARRVTLQPIDMKLALHIRGVHDPGYL